MGLELDETGPAAARSSRRESSIWRARSRPRGTLLAPLFGPFVRVVAAAAWRLSFWLVPAPAHLALRWACAHTPNDWGRACGEMGDCAGLESPSAQDGEAKSRGCDAVWSKRTGERCFNRDGKLQRFTLLAETPVVR